MGGLTIAIQDSFGQVVSGVPIKISSEEFGGDVSIWLAQGLVTGSSPSGLITGPEGELEIHGLPHGSYAWSIGSEQGEIVVPIGAMGKLKVTLAD